MNRGTSISKVVFFPMLLIGILVLGGMIPTFYEWSGANQSRPSPHTATAFYSVVGAMIAAWIALPFLPARTAPTAVEVAPVDEAGKFQFSLRTLVAITTFIAVVVAGFTSFRLIVIVWIIALAIFSSAWFVMHDLSRRWKLMSLLSCMYFPYAWVLLPGSVRNVAAEQLWAAFGLPTFVPAIFLGRFVGQRVEESIWLLIALTGIELAIGIWMICSGPRRAVAWIIVVLFLSFCGSCFLDAAMRI